ncbi:MAG: ATP-binding cassette domain-containing protein [Bacteroidetes bacterium]|nr:MAG: ATP-binding cassette domain-containing protein [Bacteroidota bacterium]
MILRAEHLMKKYGKRVVVNDVSIHVEQGEIVGLLGPNGAGKTTSFYMCVGLVKPNAGKVFLDKEDITDLPMYKRALEMTKLTKTQQRDKMEELLDEFKLTHVRKNMGKSLSGGERRRTEIARALATSPKFVLLDEPFAGVDPLATEDIQKVIYYLKRKQIGILITDHDADAILTITDRVYVMTQGKHFADGTPEELINNQEVKRAYLGNRDYQVKTIQYEE